MKLFYRQCLKKFTRKIVTTPIFYVNSKPHIGHLYSAILASAVKQVHLLNNVENIILSTGTDEHGLKIQQKAAEENLHPKLLCDRNSKLFKNLFQHANIDYDVFIRTSEDHHKEFAKKFWMSLIEKEKISKRDYSGYYSIQEESFVPEKDLIKKEDKFYTSLSIHSNVEVEYITEQNFQMKFEADDVKEYYNTIDSGKLVFNPKSILNEVKSYSNNLFDLCISRPIKRVNWGIEVPNDNEHVMYVWFEALLNYLTVADQCGKNMEQVEFIHIIGKDISKFHCYIWPLILLLNKKFPAKITILMHNYWLKNKTKMSKSLGNVIDPEAVIKKYGIDAVRFYFLASGPLLHDVNFDEKILTKIFYKNIPDSFINLILRLSINKIFDINMFSKLDIIDTDYIEVIKENLNYVELTKSELLNYNFIQAQHYIHLILINLNNLVQVSEFWKKMNDNKLINNILCICFEFIRIVTILYTPFLPQLMQNVGKFIGMSENEYLFKFCFFRNVNLSFSNNLIDLDEESINFNNKITENGYFKIDLAFKSEIFVNKIK